MSLTLKLTHQVHDPLQIGQKCNSEFTVSAQKGDPMKLCSC